MPVLTDEQAASLLEADRLGALEAEVAALRRAKQAEQTAANQPPGPAAKPRTQFASELDRLQEEKRLARLKANEEAAEVAQEQAKRDAPLLAKRNAELARLEEQEATLRVEAAKLEKLANAVRAERFALAGKALR
jgi:multidrug efflux pump subunit AcrA (membrane-fusion protein)